MSIFPNDTITVSIDEHGSTLTGIMVPSSTIDRTMVYCHISASGNQDNHISLSSTSTGRTLCDTEGNNVIDSFAPIVIPAGINVIWDKGNASTRLAAQVSFVPYNLASTTQQDYSQKTSIDTGFIVVILLLGVTVAILDFIRRIFTSKKVNY